MSPPALRSAARALARAAPAAGVRARALSTTAPRAFRFRPAPGSPPDAVPRIHLYTAGTPNGHKATIMLEEMRAAYPHDPRLAYDFAGLDLGANEQKAEEYLAINPNGRIPAIVDDNAGGLAVWESASIILWLAEQYDTEFKLSFREPDLRAQALSWIFFVHGGIGPMQGQLGHFNSAPITIPYAIKRYADEVARLYEVLDRRLTAAPYLVGRRFSVADINAYPWVAAHMTSGVDVTPFPSVAAWLARVAPRAGVRAGVALPAPRTPLTPADAAARVTAVQDHIREADRELAQVRAERAAER